MESIEIRIPPDRVGVLIGKEGEVKKRLEEKTGCRIRIDSKNGVVEITRGEDAVGFLKAKDVVNAIARGFNPDVAMRILDDDFTILESIDLSQYISPKAMERIKGRIIGKEGKMRRLIEETLNVHVSIYDKYVSIIGNVENVSAAREAIMMLIDGAQHSTVQRFMERKKREIEMHSMDWHMTA
ncbi:KH domain protein [Geoglobus ahangari]|uniref:KH domain protein n=1 Tax=Geoglobus ahangari TaxID=113653 RepID=A0A0F7IIH0_9EURY|nr:KH domain-containing protein [Geoglobus ahangari]AKG91794.1 KH domain protein [Geoglobus ahangari]NOY11564.1 RNA-processing protein [Archaeoglobi archaeon]